jgi:hypothetical protein
MNMLREQGSSLLNPADYLCGREYSNIGFRVRYFASFLLLIGIFFVFAAQTFAVELNGRLSSDLYTYEQNGQSHVRPHLGVRTNLIGWRSPDSKSFSFHTYFRWRTDLSDKLATDPRMFVYHSYFRVSGVIKRTDLYLGRQFVYCGVGSALLDGARIRLKPSGKLQLDLFGGSTVASQDPEKIRSFSDFGSLGGRMAIRPCPSFGLGLNWMLGKRDGQVSYNRLGLDGEKTSGQFQLYGRTSYNVSARRLAEILTRISYPHRGWYFSGEFDWHEPSVPENSLFSLIDFQYYQEIRLNVQRSVLPNLTVVSQLELGLLEGEDSWRTTLGVRTSFYGISLHHKGGYGGDNDGVSGFLNLQLNRQWEIFATANLYRYRVQEEQEDRSESYASSLGLIRRFGRGVTARAEGQYLRNAVQKDDARFLIRLAKVFSFNSNSGKTKP